MSGSPPPKTPRKDYLKKLVRKATKMIVCSMCQAVTKKHYSCEYCGTPQPKQSAIIKPVKPVRDGQWISIAGADDIYVKHEPANGR